MEDWSGYPLQPGEPEHTDDGRFWDGTRTHRLTGDRSWRRESDVLDAADVMVFNLLDCSPNPRVGSKRLATDSERRTIVEAGLARSVDDEGGLQRWESEDGTALALLVGELRSPRIPSQHQRSADTRGRGFGSAHDEVRTFSPGFRHRRSAIFATCPSSSPPKRC